MDRVRLRWRPIRGAATLVVFGGTAVLSGCATKGDLRDVQNDLRAVNQRLESVVDALDRQAQRTEGSLSTQSTRIGDFQGDVTRLLREIRDSLDELSAETAAGQAQITNLRTQLDNIERRLPTRSAMNVGLVPTGGERVVGGGQETPQSMYRTAMDDYNSGSYRTARFGFEALLGAHPNSSEAELALMALGRIAKETEDFDEAIERFSDLEERFLDSASRPEALYQIGVIYLEELDDEERGRVYLERLIQTYPESEMADLARAKLGGEP